MRWPSSIHSQVEAVFHSIRAFGESKNTNPMGIRSLGTWKTYRYEVHRCADYLKSHGFTNILDTDKTKKGIQDYLRESYSYSQGKGLSLQSLETKLAAIAKFEHAVNTLIEKNNINAPNLETKDIRQEIARLAHHPETGLAKTSRDFSNRAYPDPQGLIKNITDSVHRLQASLQYEGGLRTEGVGAPSNHLSNPLTVNNLGGLITDPVTGRDVGLIKDVCEKGGKLTDHMVSENTYRHLENHIKTHGHLQSDYKEYVRSINEAARITGQFEPGRGSHGLKHNFAQERYQECSQHGFTHEQAMQQTSLELAHFRYYETYTYTRR